MEKPKVLFLCTGNSVRSQIAEALLRKYGGEHFDVYSAGLEPHGIHPYTILVMKEKGIDMSGHRSKSLDEYLEGFTFSYLITVCGNADERCPFFPGMGKRIHWPFEDPAAFIGSDEEKINKFREISNQIELKIIAWLKEQNFQD